MTLQPGQKTFLKLQFMMHGAMGGPHHFRVHLLSNDPANPEYTLDVTSDWVE